MACDANTLMAQAAANGYYGLDDRSLKIAILQLLCSGGGGGGGGITLAQALAYVEANADAFALGVAFAQGVTAAAGKITLNVDGSASFANGLFVINQLGSITPAAMQTAGDIEISNTASGIILTAPDASQWRIKVDNAGNLGTEAA